MISYKFTVFSYMKITSLHIFEKVLICIERGLYSVYLKEMKLEKNEKGVLFYQPAELFRSFSQLE